MAVKVIFPSLFGVVPVQVEGAAVAVYVGAVQPAGPQFAGTIVTTRSRKVLAQSCPEILTVYCNGITGFGIFLMVSFSGRSEGTAGVAVNGSKEFPTEY